MTVLDLLFDTYLLWSSALELYLLCTRNSIPLNIMGIDVQHQSNGPGVIYTS